MDATRIAMEKPLTRTTVFIHTTTSYAIARLTTNVHIQRHVNSPCSRYYYPEEDIDMLQTSAVALLRFPISLLGDNGGVLGKAHRGADLVVVAKWALPHTYPESIRE